MTLFELKNVSFKNITTYNLIIKENITTFVCGKSGTGKSTLLKLLNATVSKDSGEIYYKNKSIEQYDTINLRKEVMLVSQNVFLFDDTIKNNFNKFYEYRNEYVKDDNTKRDMLKLCAIDFDINTDCQNMSGGERQRIFTAIHLSFMPKILMLDEPTSALDAHTSDLLINNLKNYCEQNCITLIIISHDKTLIQKYKDDVINLDGGAIDE